MKFVKEWFIGFSVMWFIVVLLTCLGCGTIDAMEMDGGAGAAGAGGSMVGSGGSGGASACTPDACNTCVDGAKTPIPDGTSCDTAWCDPSKTAVSPFGGSYMTTTIAPSCQAGVCVQTAVKCSDKPCSCTNVGYAGCFNDNGPAGCKCVNTTGGFCD